MSKCVGYIITRFDGEKQELFWGFMGQSQTPHWVPPDHQSARDLLIFQDHVEAEKFRMSHSKKLPASRVEPLIIGKDAGSIDSWEKFQEACKEDLDSGDPTMSTQHDECAAQVFTQSDNDGSSGIMSELLDTGSVTVRVKDKNYVVLLEVQEAPE